MSVLRTFTFTFTFTFTWTVAGLGQMTAAGWQAAPASGVEMRLASDSGRLRVDFDFHGGGGWAAFRRDTLLQLTDNYEITFRLKGDAPRNTLELKLVDRTGENVWWVRRPDFEFAGDWRTITFRKRHVEFAWGPRGGGEIREVGAIEFAITAGNGGKGAVWIDDLRITPRPPVRETTELPIISRTPTSYTLDLREPREYGGLTVGWKRGGKDRAYDVQISSDGSQWQTVRRLRGGRRAKDLLQLPETESRYLRIVLLNDSVAGIDDVRIEPLAFGATHNRLYELLARDAGDDRYPAYFKGTQTYWTVVGNPGAPREALINEYGALEIDKRGFSLEPFLHDGEKLIGWRAAQSTTLERGYLPIPSVTWQTPDLQLRTTTWADGQALWVRYRVTNRTPQSREVKLYVALRPFQVNPPTQFLNTPGGVTPITNVSFNDNRVDVDGHTIVPVTRPAQFGTTTFDGGDITDFIRSGGLPAAQAVSDTAVHLASAALAYPLALGARDSSDVVIAIPFMWPATLLSPASSLTSALESWRARLERFEVAIPAQPSIGASLRSNLAYVLINQDGPAIQPGSRSYERSWIRDGSLTSAALLRLGQLDAVQGFIDWYARFQYADGKVPCCVDQRGADPVPENDSHGQLIYLITEYFRYSADTVLVRRTWPNVVRAVGYLDSLRNSRRTAEYRGSGFWGLLPQSISHEGYSAKPMHSYWDDFFALKGLRDAAWLAQQLGDAQHARAWMRVHDEFKTDLMNSFRWTMQNHGIDYLAGSVELGDFDATSTTVGLNPAGAQHDLPQPALRRTFERYWEDFQLRRANWQAFQATGDTTNRWRAYTPYEWRVAGALVRLGERARAHEVVNWFMQHQRPAGWNHWAEVVYRDPLAASFIGDMPHTWVGSDFIRSVLDMFVYDEDERLIIGAGIAPQWIEASTDTVKVSGIHTPYGEIAYRVFRDARTRDVVFLMDRRPQPPRGFVVRALSREARLSTLPRRLVLKD